MDSVARAAGAGGFGSCRGTVSTEGLGRLIANAGPVHVAPGVLSPSNMAGGIM